MTWFAELQARWLTEIGIPPDVQVALYRFSPELDLLYGVVSAAPCRLTLLVPTHSLKLALTGSHIRDMHGTHAHSVTHHGTRRHCVHCRTRLVRDHRTVIRRLWGL